MIAITDPNGNVTRATFDLARRPVETTTAATPAAPGGVVTTSTYDADGRLLQARQSSAGTVLRTTSATWTPTGQQASATDANGNVTTFAYDVLDRLARTTDAEGRVTTFEYGQRRRKHRELGLRPPLQAQAPHGRRHHHDFGDRQRQWRGAPVQRQPLTGRPRDRAVVGRGAPCRAHVARAETKARSGGDGRRDGGSLSAAMLD